MLIYSMLTSNARLRTGLKGEFHCHLTIIEVSVDISKNTTVFLPRLAPPVHTRNPVQRVRNSWSLSFSYFQLKAIQEAEPNTRTTNNNKTNKKKKKSQTQNQRNRNESNPE